MFNIKKINTILLLGFSIFLLIDLNSCKREITNQSIINLLPTPQKIKLKKGISIKPRNIKTIYLYAQADKKDKFASSLLQDKVDSLFGRKVKVQMVGSGSYKNIFRPAIVLGIPSADRDFSNFCSSLDIPTPQKNTKQSYVIDIGENMIVISGGGAAGLFYGIQTVNQILEDAKWIETPLPGMLIQDWPDIKWRAVQFDEKHHLDHYKYLKKAIVKLAKYKVNTVVFEFEDKFDYKSHPIIAAPHSFTPKQIKSLTKYAHKYHINIVPLVQGLGHASYILKHPKFKDLRADPNSVWAFNPLKKGTYNLLFDMYHETIKATPGAHYFHVGGDEVRFTGNNPRLQAYKKKHGPFSLYLRWLNKVNDYVNDHGRTMIFWDDMPEKIAGLWSITQHDYPDGKFHSLWIRGIAKLDSVINRFPKNAIYMQWMNGTPTRGTFRVVKWLKNHGLNVFIATSTQQARPLIQNYVFKPANIRKYLTNGAKMHVFGELCNAWDDSDPHFETYWFGFLASAEYGWHGKNHPISLKQYWEKYIYRFFGPNTTGLYQAFHNLSKRVHFWNTAIIKKGSGRTKRTYFRTDNPSALLLNLPSTRKVPPEGSWAAHFQSLMEKAEKEKKKNTQAIETLMKNMDKVKRNSYNLKVFATLGRFMKADAELVISIGKIARYADQARVADRSDQSQKVISDLNKMAALADSDWSNYKASFNHLEKVWHISRYPKGGKGYVPYRYGHLASQRENLSYLIMAEQALDLPGYAQRLRELSSSLRKKAL
jgi:hypothetical protein